MTNQPNYETPRDTLIMWGALRLLAVLGLVAMILAGGLLAGGCGTATSGGVMPQTIGPVRVSGEGGVRVDTDLDGRPASLSVLVQADHEASAEDRAAGSAWLGRVAVCYSMVCVTCDKARGEPAQCSVGLNLSHERPQEGQEGPPQ